MSFAAVAGITAGIIGVFAWVPYIRSIFQGETRPNRATYTIWTVVSTIVLFSYFSAGARDTIWYVLVYSVVQYFVLGLSFKYGMGGFNKFDGVCLTIALLGVILWISTDNPLTALYLNIALEVIGYLPTIKKSYLYPSTESTMAWVLAMFAGLANVFAITSFVLHIALYPVVILICNTSIAVLLLFPSAGKYRKLQPPDLAK